GKVALQTLLGSVSVARAFAGTCDPFPPSSWNHPSSIGSFDVANIEGTDIAVRSYGGITYAFITSTSILPTAPDFEVFNVSDLTHPILVAQLDTGPGLNGIALGENFAYAVQNDTHNQLQVINISNPEVPTVVSNITLTGVSSAGSFPQGWRVAYYNKRVYVGTRETAGPEFYIYDVSVPATPMFLGRIELTHTINDIAVSGDYAYLATSADYGELTMINITNPASLSLPPNYTDPAINNQKFNAVALPGGGASTEDGSSVYVLGNTVFLGRKRTTTGVKRDFYILDASNISAITARGSIRINLASNTEISGLVAQGDRAFLATTDPTKPIVVLALTDTDPVIIPNCSMAFVQITKGLSYFNNYLFTANKSDDLLRVFYDTNACT
ncbi:hypothetical protein KW798_03170, partial [Candidatus Parcubacteria bacterium]|nr:hypothetical protein [Candidatus Parcubacteria bacterium]